MPIFRGLHTLDLMFAPCMLAPFLSASAGFVMMAVAVL